MFNLPSVPFRGLVFDGTHFVGEGTLVSKICFRSADINIPGGSKLSSTGECQGAAARREVRMKPSVVTKKPALLIEPITGWLCCPLSSTKTGSYSLSVLT